MANTDKITVRNYTILKEEDVPGAKLKEDPEKWKGWRDGWSVGVSWVEEIGKERRSYE